ncbi:hypothetical protein ACXU4B_04365 [Dyella soli]|uniref:hypothetical protein n=1 Tax=Dyella soli TaxID=522319 RepID=UPI0013F3E01E|nr:hypothetical protein [Dyella soli]
MSSVIVAVLALSALVIEVVIMRVLEKDWILARASRRSGEQAGDRPEARLDTVSG